MLPQIKHLTEPQNKPALRNSTEALCADLERETAQFESGAVSATQLRNIYATLYRAKTTELMESLMYYAPTNWGFTLAQTSAGRIFSSVDYTLATSELYEGLELSHLTMIVRALRDLLSRVPQN
jgi:hypothetical protein